MIGRYWIYQRERFPLAAHVPLVIAFSFSAVSFSALLRGANVADPSTLLVAFVVSLCSFFQLRVADEFKDADEDARFRPYRPVPRGLVTLRELRWAGIASAIVQVVLSVALSPYLILILLVIWGYFSLMSVEFFARRWLKARPVIYLLSHMCIMPLVDLYATACDWLVVGSAPQPGLLGFLVVSFCNGIVIEIGRKIRARSDEEPGVETYSAIWGARRAIAAWLLAMLASAGMAMYAASFLGFARMIGLALLTVFCMAITAARVVLCRGRAGDGRLCEYISAVWTLVLYLGLGTVPYLLTAR